MLGSMLFNSLSQNRCLDVWGTARHYTHHKLSLSANQCLLYGDLLKGNTLNGILKQAQPDVVINCVGIIKQKLNYQNIREAIAINASLPHYLAHLCQRKNIRLVHISTDCVFSGNRGRYTELDHPDAKDLYGRTKRYGELLTFPNTLTLRTSIIGHEQGSHYALLDWFLAQDEEVRGFSQALFSGFTTLELSRLLEKIILHFPDLRGLYHLSAEPIDKCSLLKLIAEIYGKNISITADASVAIDRSLDSKMFRRILNYHPPSWAKMLEDLHTHYQKKTGGGISCLTKKSY